MKRLPKVPTEMALLVLAYNVAASVARSAILEQPNNFFALIAGAAANAMTGNLDAARNAMKQALQLDPNFRRITDRIPFRQPEVVARWEDVLRKAGLPE
jgi:adenylate cyclase